MENWVRVHDAHRDDWQLKTALHIASMPSKHTIFNYYYIVKDSRVSSDAKEQALTKTRRSDFFFWFERIMSATALVICGHYDFKVMSF